MMQPGGSDADADLSRRRAVAPHYNVMGVAKAALEASVRYLAADLGPAADAGERDQRRADQDAGGQRHRRFPLHPAGGTNSTRRCAATSPSRKSAAPGVYLLSDLSRGVTGEVHHVDCGYHMVGMKNPDAPDIAVSSD